MWETETKKGSGCVPRSVYMSVQEMPLIFQVLLPLFSSSHPLFLPPATERGRWPELSGLVR